ncbi:MAG: DUF6268 family outer membrane beta-barrel protein [Ferruginibacter sp.]
MQKKLFIIIACLATLDIIAQPYIDPINIRYTNAFRHNKNNATPFSHLYIGSDLPFKTGRNSFIVLSPFYEKWNIDSASNKEYLPQASSIAIAVSAIFPLDNDHWSLTITAISRFNSEGLNLDNSFQMGGLLLAGYKIHENLKYKVGVYVNNEFFGLFVMPLAGIDWKINDRNNLFGTLPGRLTYEHKLSNNFYTGATFRAITNSYRFNNGTYLRIEDNQLSAYLDCYATKHIVFTGEAGYGIFRKLRSGAAHNKIYLADYQWGDGMFIKLSAAYRVRL